MTGYDALKNLHDMIYSAATDQKSRDNQKENKLIN